MKYVVALAEVLMVADGKQNAGESYVKLMLQPEDIFDPKSHVVCMFVNQALIPKYQELCKDITKFPLFNGSEEIVEGLPPFNFMDDKGSLIQPARTSMSVFVRINADGKLADDPRTQAIRTIKQLGKFVDVDSAPISAPVTPVVTPPVVEDIQPVQ